MIGGTVGIQDQAELRRKRRQPLRYLADIVIDQRGSTCSCSILDISDSGARLSIDEEVELPDRFILLLNKSGDARRVCHLVWREGKNLGVRFVRSPEQNRKVM
jgi:hypothetical protein